jgi:hypothetical protein
MNWDVQTKIGMTLLNKLIGTTGRVQNAGCSRDVAAADQLFPYVIFKITYQLTAPSDSMEFRAADSDMDLERHVLLHLI